MNMHDPAHPGELLTGWLDELDVSVTAFAAHIGISRVMLSRVLHGHAAVSADMDLRLAEALGTSPGYWLALQNQRDLWTARVTAKERKKIKRVAVPELAPT
jgi:addiction module HigA family antidote